MSDLPPSAGETPPFTRAMTRAVAHLLRPLARALLARGVTLAAVIEHLKAAYVEAAEGELARNGEKRTDSRISVMTGVHRKDVRRLRAGIDAAYQAPGGTGLAVQVVARWLATQPFAQAPGKPAPLDRSGPGGFEDLVASVSTDVRGSVVLEDLERLGLVEPDADGRLCLTAAAFTPPAGSDGQAWYFGRNLHDHLAAAAHNISGDGPPLMERAVHYSQLSPQSLATLQAEARKRGEALLLDMNALALSLKQADSEKQADSGASDATGRMALGVYYFETPEDDTPEKDG